MAAIVCHGLQTCLECHLVDSRTLSFGSFSFHFSKPHTPPQNPIDLPVKTSFWDSTSKTNGTTEWSFLEVLSNVSSGSKEPTEKESVYVHPQAKRSTARMSEKSLELCTEKLGNETGSDIVENNGCDMALLCSSPTGEQVRPRQGCLGGRKARTQNFPPPLTTISGSESLRVRSHREDGRLVIEAIKVPPSPTCFQAKRSHGRLRLSVLKDHNFDQEDKQPNNDNEGAEEEWESEKNERIGDMEGAEEEEEEEEEAGETGEVGEETRRKKYEMPRRCNEGGDEQSLTYDEMLIKWGERRWIAI